MIDQEVRTVYYAALVRERRCTCDAEEFTAAFAAADPADVPLSGDPLAVEESDAQRNVLTQFGIDPDQGWDWRQIAGAATPTTTSPRPNGSAAGYGPMWTWTSGRPARATSTGPRKAALDVLRDLRNEIRLLVDHGGLSGDSYRDDLQRWYMPLNAYLSIGPPAERIEQFGALMDAGVLEVLGPDLRVGCSDGRFVAHSRSLPGPHRAGRHADRGAAAGNRPAPHHRSAAADAAGTAASAGRTASRSAAAVTTSPAVSRSPGVRTGCSTIADRPHPRRFAFGVPTESVHWVTAAGIRPGRQLRDSRRRRRHRPVLPAHRGGAPRPLRSPAIAAIYPDDLGRPA